jgi:hypothetical protein
MKPDFDTDTIPMHPVIAELLMSVADLGDGRMGFSPRAMESCRQHLLTDLREEPMVLVNLLVAWSRFSGSEITLDPATSQLYELLLLFPTVLEAKRKEDLLARAQAMARSGAQTATTRMAGGLEPPHKKR